MSLRTKFEPSARKIKRFFSKLPLAATYELVEKRVKGCPYRVYVLDDQMAVKIDSETVDVVGEGEFETFDPE